MARVSFHFVRGNNPEKFASTIVNFMGKVRLFNDVDTYKHKLILFFNLLTKMQQVAQVQTLS